MIAPTMLYGAAAWSHAAKTHIRWIQVVQNKALRNVVDAPWYVRNTTIGRDLEIPTIKEVISERTD